MIRFEAKMAPIASKHVVMGYRKVELPVVFGKINVKSADADKICFISLKTVF